MSCQSYAAIGEAEPRAWVFRAPGCTGNSLSIPAGQRINDLNVSPYNTIQRNEISAIVVPPNMRLTAYARTNLDANGPVGVYDGTVLGKGVWSDLRVQHEGVGNDDIESIKLDRVKDWQQFKIDCCMNRDHPDRCRQFWGGSNTGACIGVMQQHCSPANMNRPECRSWCVDNPGKCDAAVIEYCRQNPADPLCACLVSPLRAPSCFDIACMSGAYRTSAMQEQTNNCPSVIDCRQTISVGDAAYNNIIDVSKLSQNCIASDGTGGDPIPDPDPEPEPEPTPYHDFTLLVIVLFILVVAIAVGVLTWYLLDDDDPWF